MAFRLDRWPLQRCACPSIFNGWLWVLEGNPSRYFDWRNGLKIFMNAQTPMYVNWRTQTHHWNITRENWKLRLAIDEYNLKFIIDIQTRSQNRLLHRSTCKPSHVGEFAKDRDVLNCFCYTADSPSTLGKWSKRPSCLWFICRCTCIAWRKYRDQQSPADRHTLSKVMSFNC